MLKTVVTIFQIILAISLIAVIVIQARGTGLGSAWGGTSESYRSKRGVERILFGATIALAVIFFLISIVNIAF
jgi:preprotein translocase subunit SecG